MDIVHILKHKHISGASYRLVRVVETHGHRIGIPVQTMGPYSFRSLDAVKKFAKQLGVIVAKDMCQVDYGALAVDNVKPIE